MNAHDKVKEAMVLISKGAAWRSFDEGDDTMTVRLPDHGHCFLVDFANARKNPQAIKLLTHVLEEIGLPVEPITMPPVEVDYDQILG